MYCCIQRCRNAVHYTADGDLVYCIGRFGIVYSFKQHSQRIFDGHTDEVLCLQMHPDKRLVATGEAGPNPRLVVWDSSYRSDEGRGGGAGGGVPAMKVCFSSRGYHSNGIVQVGAYLRRAVFHCLELDT